MGIFEAALLGIVQGFTEFLPVSSSGHLVVLPQVFGLGSQPLVFDVVLHLGTVFALVYYFHKDLLSIAKGLYADFSSKKQFNKYSAPGKIGVFILIGSLPAGFLGVLLENYIEVNLRSVASVVIFLTVGSLLMYGAEVFRQKVKKKNLDSRGALAIGLFQSLALFPGVSRSGATISGGMLFGLSREEAARFSFLLSVPIVVLAGLFKVSGGLADGTLSSIGFLPLFVGFIASFGSGILAISFLLKFLKSNALYIFVAYRVLLAFILVYLSSALL